MFRRYKLPCICLVLCSLFMTVVVFAEKAPDFSLKDINGKVFNLSDFKGKVVFLDFWTTWCQPCRSAIPAIKELHKTARSNLVVLGININEKQSIVKDFVKTNGMNYDILFGDDKTCSNYKVDAFPLFIIIDANGEIVKRYRGYCLGLEKEWDRVVSELIEK